ncbi:zinc finger MYM-type protein 4 isoform X1 [Anastrepha ludens]|uniref:zinc finger MYM-type protein 4 isoform X1 n=1 Tax=Anastrepha ludens TaxID=28586 RepID=UPI0023B0B9B5|nr:zinc finger MYM-type protein 4 isoform X1 [Anastrepha ludens]XP_053969458.1 zinc finger MYM-type protein 4 isoform X1 [Anastrepha ludens]XP_053969459.1 zinc finger MYM-type protein 4 isoform X1 [Anastrepha ludens]XP_053969460.1 zinc finger MYM-type protein 4 isoform X1 [Anastrepha ludens]XP_053969462.1 zinc finger MYM-type protein 4 isoform X1 [Anastrepha ludens]XP_053969463.1 zinc finger MYM-type protein 4 isoform X1 [Anastrepha ludens]
MEEISSLDSFHTDAESSARPESEPPKLDEDTSRTSMGKAVDGDTTKDAEDGNNDEDFEQISDGSFEVDENSNGTSSGPPKDEGSSTQDKVASGEGDKGEDEDKEPDTAETKTQESTDFEEVDANVSGGGHNAATEESDMLGESDMTLPTPANELEAEPINKSVEAMEVDKPIVAEGGTETEAGADTQLHTPPGDVDMPSVSNSPAANEAALVASEDNNADKINEKSMEEENADVSAEQLDISMEALEDVETGNDDAKTPGEDNEYRTEPDGEAIEEGKDSKDEVDDTTNVGGEDGKQPSMADNESGIVEKVSQKAGGEEVEVEREDEPVENVQEPEDSDICLIPDDTESEVTEAEKEQAILARENAEKEDAEAEAEKEKERETEAIAAAEVVDAPTEKEASAAEGGDAEIGETIAEAQADPAGAEVADAGSGSNEEPRQNTAEEAVDAPDADEPLLEEMQTSTTETGSTPKIIIAWILSSMQKCIQCGTEKACGFRYKSPENDSLVYVCDQNCCDALLSANPGKYFIRRKKFLIEELSNEPKDPSSTETSGDGNVQGGIGEKDANSHMCLQCKEVKVCKYFFRQDDEQHYICSDICYNLLNSEEPEKFKLKRHSIRVRNIGATLTTAVASVGVSTPSSTTTTTGTKTKSPRDTGVVARTAAEAEAARLERNASFMRRCAECFNEVTLGDKNLLWETMDFCNEICLGKYQRTIGANCQTCHGEVPHPALGKYCVRFGFDIRQFCCAACLNEFKKGLKTCSCCQKDISSGSEGFLAPVGDKEQFKDFCSQACMRRYDSMCNPKKKLRNDTCAVCNNDKPVRVEIMLDGKEHNFCSNPCFSAFKFVSNIVADQCAMCSKYFERKGSESFTIYTERRTKVFCTRVCLNVYIIVNRRIVSCQWCKVKKYNFDMIYKQQDAQEILMCSLNCLTLYGVSINAFSRTVANCDNCSTSATPQYHLTMSDASMRNFCTYQCVMQFQSQFARAPLTLENDSPSTQQTTTVSQTGSNNSNVPFPTGLPKRVKLKMPQQPKQPIQIKLPSKTTPANKKGPTMPVISTVSSLASGETETMIGNVTVRRGRGRGRKMDSPPPIPQIPAPQVTVPTRGRPRKQIDYAASPSPPPIQLPPPVVKSVGKRGQSTSVSTHVEKGVGETRIIAVPPYPPAVRNVQTSCKPQTVTVGFQTTPNTTNTASQTGKDYSNKVLIPVPVPIYVPQPMYMYSAPFPVPIPIPLPIPVPIFIPTTRNSAQGILKEIKKIQDKMPADPFEAELLMMAEMVAEEKHESDSDSEDEVKTEPSLVPIQYNNDVQPVEVANNSYGEEVLQMALKMATGEYDQPAVDLESAMTASEITNPPPGMVGHDDSMSHMSAHHMQQQQPHHIMEAQRGGRGRKRGGVTSPVSPRSNNRSPVKRSRLDIEPAQPPPQPIQPVEKPDANMCLKYTFGVNAWKQWVMTKNADIEKSTTRRRPFKTELLQMTADELNYSLCLFVKEVRKPNGTEYAPDTIYYLVLGIQQYLYENGRIDNIFTDPYYERFTDCLDEVARKFSVLYNDSQYIVTRVEEEHLWECKQLGAHSPHVLLSTLMFFNTKHFNLTTVEEHMQLSFSHIMKHWKRSAQNAKMPGTRNVLLRFYPPQAGLDANPRKKKVYEQQENEENPLRCPVRLYEFYLSKCPESVKTRNDVFYLQPERSCVPDSPVWYSTQALSQESLQKMLHRVKMVKEINIALLTS